MRTAKPEIRVVQGTVDVEPDVQPGSTFSDFPDVDPGEPTSRSWNIWNTGLANLDVSAITVTGNGFSLIVDPAPATVEPFEGNTNRFADFRVRLHSSTPGIKLGEVRIFHNAATNNPFVFNLRGEVRSPQEVTLAHDSFANSVNGPLHGRVTDTGGRTWVANSNAVLRRVTGTENGYVSGVATLLGTISYGNNGVRPAIVEARIRPQGSTYAAIGFSASTNGGWWAPGEGQVWVRIFPNGQYQVCADGTRSCVTPAARSITNFLGLNVLNTVKLRYDPLSRKVDLWINGVQEIAGTSLPGSFTPTLLRAGTYAFQATTFETRFDDFSLREEQ